RRRHRVGGRAAVLRRGPPDDVAVAAGRVADDQGASPPMTTLGLVAKTGWAAAVVLDGPVDDPVVVDRRRLDLLPPGTPGHAYHAAAALAPPAAAALIAKVP